MSSLVPLTSFPVNRSHANHLAVSSLDKENLTPAEETPLPTGRQRGRSPAKIAGLVQLAQESWARDPGSPPKKKPRFEFAETEEKTNKKITILPSPLARTLSEETIVY